MAKGVFSWVLWITIIVLFIIIVWQLFLQLPISAFRDSFLGNFCATMIGIIAGIPIALSLDRRQQAEAQKIEKQKIESERLDREKRILELIKNELIYNKELLEYIIEKQVESPGIVTYAGLKKDLWNTLSAGGDLQSIRDLDLLDGISNAYYYIGRIIFLEEKFFDPGFHMRYVKIGSTDEEHTYGGKPSVNAVNNLRPSALQSIEHVLSLIQLWQTRA